MRFTPLTVNFVLHSIGLFLFTLGLKYFVERTKIGKNLPIYTEYRNGGNNCFTLIKRISGDAASLPVTFQNILRKLTRKQHQIVKMLPVILLMKAKKETTCKEVENKRELGHVWIHGNHTQIVRKFLESKDFKW